MGLVQILLMGLAGAQIILFINESTKVSEPEGFVYFYTLIFISKRRFLGF